MDDDGQIRAAKQAFDEIALGVRDLATATPAGSWQAFVLSLKEEFRNSMDSHGRYYDLEMENTQLREAFGVVEDFGRLREETCRDLLVYVKRLHQRLYEQLIKELDDRAVRALELGGWVDRGVRPENVHCYMEQKSPVNETRTGASVWQEKAATPRTEEQNYLTERVVEEGEIPPDSFWPKQIIRLCNELKFSKEQIQSIFQLLQKMTLAEVASTIKKIDEIIRRVLVNSGELPTWLRVDLLNHVIHVDNTPHNVDLEVALFVRQVAARRGDFASMSELAAEDARLEGFRPDKVLKAKSHRFIKDFIAGEGGKGYRLTRI